MFLIAITGGIATGKSTVAKFFIDHGGITVIDADLIARQIVEPFTSAWRQIKETFGDEILQADKTINRDALGKIIFNNLELRRKLNEITHPIIHRTIFLQIFQNFMSGKNYVVLDLPLLFETGILLDFIHKIICVTCDEDIQVKRLMERSSLTEEEAKKRISCQMPLEKKCEKSNFVIENSGSFEMTEKEVIRILSILSASNHHWTLRFYMLAGICLLLFGIFWLNRFFNFIPL